MLSHERFKAIVLFQHQHGRKQAYSRVRARARGIETNTSDAILMSPNTCNKPGMAKTKGAALYSA